MKTLLEKGEELRAKMLSLAKKNIKDKVLLKIVINQSVVLLHAPSKFEYVLDGMLGFIIYSQQNQENENYILENLIHDLGEYCLYKYENWFSPRTKSYSKYYNNN